MADLMIYGSAFGEKYHKPKWFQCYAYAYYNGMALIDIVGLPAHIVPVDRRCKLCLSQASGPNVVGDVKVIVNSPYHRIR